MLTVPSSVQTAIISALLALINTKLDKYVL